MTRDELIRMVDGLDRDGGFAKALGQACLLADDDNLMRLFQAFPEILCRHKIEERVRLAWSVPTLVS